MFLGVPTTRIARVNGLSDRLLRVAASTVRQPEAVGKTGTPVKQRRINGGA